MAFIQTVPVDQATGEVRALYERTQASLGYVPNYAKVFSHRPAVMAAWSALLASIRGNLEPRQYELITLAAAAARCFFSKVLDALGALPDAAYAELDADLKRELTPGRPISPETPERIPEVPDRPPRPA
jgi:hypothetical protein